MGESVPKACDAAIGRIDLVLQRLMNLESFLLNQKKDQKPAVEESLRLVLAAMRELDSSTDPLSDVEVPAKLLQWVDEGKDPDAFFKQLFDDTIWTSQVMKGKLEAVGAGRQSLDAKLQSSVDVNKQTDGGNT